MTAAHRPRYGGGTQGFAGLLGRAGSVLELRVKKDPDLLSQSQGESNTEQICSHDKAGSPAQQAGIPGDRPVVLIRLAARRTQPSATVFLFTLGGVPKGLHDHPNQHPKFSSMA